MSRLNCFKYGLTIMKTGVIITAFFTFMTPTYSQDKSQSQELTSSSDDLEPGQAPLTYTVEEGDTLYDICDQLIDNSDYWPKLWSLNPDIKNPHFIEAGTKLRFYADDRFWTGRSKFVTSEDVVPIDNALLTEGSIVPDHNIDHLVANNTINKEAEFVSLDDLPGTFQNQTSTFGYIHDPTRFTVVLPAFIYEKDPPSIGEVLIGTENEILGTNPSEFLLSPKAGQEFEIEKTYTVIRPKDRVYSSRDNKDLGVRYDFVGHIHVTGKLKQDSKDLYQSRIVYSNLGIAPGDLVIPYRSTFKHYGIQNKVKVINDTSSTVFSMELQDQSLGKHGEIVFLDKDLYLDAYYPVYQDVYLNNGMGFSGDPVVVKKQVAIIKIIASYSSYSVGVVVNQTFPIKYGDSLGKELEAG